MQGHASAGPGPDPRPSPGRGPDSGWTSAAESGGHSLPLAQYSTAPSQTCATCLPQTQALYWDAAVWDPLVRSSPAANVQQQHQQRRTAGTTFSAKRQRAQPSAPPQMWTKMDVEMYDESSREASSTRSTSPHTRAHVLAGSGLEQTGEPRPLADPNLTQRILAFIANFPKAVRRGSEPGS